MFDIFGIKTKEETDFNTILTCKEAQKRLKLALDIYEEVKDLLSKLSSE